MRRIRSQFLGPVLLAAAAGLVFVPSVSAAKFFDSTVGVNGNTAGLTFGNAPRDVAVNDPSVNDGNAAANGDFYIVDDVNHRIQRVNADGTFDLAWGADVVVGGTTGFEICVTAGSCKAGPGTAAPTAPTNNLLNGGLDNPQGIAVDQDTGNVYVSDRDNRRVSQYTAGGVFVRSFGFDVLATASEAQSVTVSAASGSFTLSYGAGGPGVGTTGDIPVGAAAGTVQTALNGLSNIAGGGGSVTVSGPVSGVYTVTFGGNLANTDVANQIAAASSAGDPLVGGTATTALVHNGSAAGAGYEVCNATQVCKIGVGVNNGPAGQFSLGSTTNGYRLDVSKPDGNSVTGKVFLANTGSRRVETFNLDGTSPANFGSDAQFASSQPLGVAVDAGGVVYAIAGEGGSGNGNPLARYSTVAGAFISPISLQALTGNTLARSGVEVDRAGHLFVTTANASVGVFEIASPATTPTLVATHPTAAPAGTFVPTGVGVNPDTGKLLVPAATTSGAFQGRTVVFDDDGLSPIEIALLPATNVDATTAGLHATINPAPNGPTGQPTTYRFEVSKTGLAGDWVQVTANLQVPPNGDTNADTAVQAEATGLEPNTFYRVRVVAVRAGNSGGATSAELSFLTDPRAPTAETISASQVSDSGAQLNGKLHPGGLTTTYWFEWGDDSYGNQTPVPAATATGGVEQAVGATLSGLEPERYYHFRLCAQNSAASAPVCGADRLFLTRGSSASAPSGRAYEMVTSPDKVLRRGGDHGAGPDAPEYVRFNGGVPDLDGGALMIGLYAGVNDPDSGAGWSGDFNYEVRTRGDRDGDGQADGWYGTSLQDVPPAWAVNGAINDQRGLSGDFSVSAWDWKGQLFENESVNSIHVLDDDGGPRGAGWYPWLDGAWFPVARIPLQTFLFARIAQHGERLVGWGDADTRLRELRAVGDTLAPADLSPPQTSGTPLFLADPSSDWAPRDLVNECSGTAGEDATLLPARVGSGVPADAIGERECGTGSSTSVLGALLGGTRAQRLEGAGITSLSDGGERIFFASPDPVASATPLFCTGAVEAATSCPPQLFVRQYDDEGDATVRWLSRAEDALFNAPQQIGLLGNGVSFEGAARDGSAVYFRTNAPLTVDDPNGGAQLPGGHTTGTASPVSWDLYRYELGADNGADPGAGDPGDRLTRVSGGPSFDADPNTNCTAASADCGGAANGGGSAVRFMSDDGSRVYFVTSGPIGDADDSWNDAPDGSAATNVPSGGASSNTSTRNIYLYDENESGEDAYRFVARIPFAASGALLDHCTSFKPSGGDAPRYNDVGGATLQNFGSSCVHGTRRGDALVFETTARLTADDMDTAADVYLYDQQEHSLVRLSAPPAGTAPYVCATDNAGVVVARCNGDLGFGLSSGALGAGGGADIGTIGMRNLNVAEAADGTLDAVYFESAIPLLPNDRNADRMDVYEYRRSDGRLSLVSPGHPDHGSFYSGNSFDGEDVFFWTENRISPWEIDDGDGDVYDARRGGGIPDPPAIPPVCGVLADVCQGDGSESVASDAKTLSSSGGGNAAVGGRTTLAVSSLSRKATRRASRIGRLALSVRTSSTGRLSLTVRARLGKKAAQVGRASKPVRSAGTVKVSVRLSSAARERLRAGSRLRLTVEVRQAGARSRTISILLPGVES